MQLALQNRIFKDEQIKIPKSIPRDVINHKHYRAFLVFLQLKPLYVSGIILNDAGNIPYQAMAAYLGLSISGLRGKIKQLKKYKLIKVDREKNFHLASYKTFVQLFKPQFLRRMRKYTFKNIAPADMLIRTAAIQENFRKQEYILKNKIINKEIYGTVNAHVDRIKQPEGFSSSIAQHDCHTGPQRTDLSKTAIRKCRKILLGDYTNLLHKQKRLFLEEIEQVENGLPVINPYITLSCGGFGRLFGTGTTSGYYQRQKLVGSNILSIQERERKAKINPVSPYACEDIRNAGGNVFSYSYPVKKGRTGREDKFFMRLPDLLNVNLTFIYANAKN